MKDGKDVCYIKVDKDFIAFGFGEVVNPAREEGFHMHPVAWTLTSLDAATETKIRASPRTNVVSSAWTVLSRQYPPCEPREVRGRVEQTRRAGQPAAHSGYTQAGRPAKADDRLAALIAGSTPIGEVGQSITIYRRP